VLKPDFSQRSNEKEMKQIFGTAKSREVRNVPFRQWGSLVALAAACITVIVASLYGILPHPTTAPVNNARTLPAPAHAPSNIRPQVALTPAYVSRPTLVAFAKPKHQLTTPPTEPALAHNELASLENEIDRPANVTMAKALPASTRITVADTILEQSPMTHASTTVPLLVSELPQGHFVHPVVSRSNLVGELKLRALIGPDGLVKNVTVLSGDPKLAEAGMRAVRQWHYAPYQVLGSPVEVETQINISFFGQDAVSIASVAAGPPPGARVASIPSPHDQPLSTKPND
jgi:outer membrane biosynthesis protein TonB